MLHTLLTIHNLVDPQTISNFFSQRRLKQKKKNYLQETAELKTSQNNTEEKEQNKKLFIKHTVNIASIDT